MSSPLRVAIVGLGPKGLFALERLLHHAHLDGAALDIDLFEPHPVPAAGPFYDPAEPSCLRLNVAAARVDAWCAGSIAVPRSLQLSLDEWRLAHLPGDAEGPYPPRALVGRYLAHALELLLVHQPAHVSVTLRPCAVSGLQRRDGGWTLTADGEPEREYDDVLLCTGHRRARPAQDVWPHAAPPVHDIFPVRTRLSRAAVAPGSRVAVRGFALTFIDAALALTEGRGGAFVPTGHPYRLGYRSAPGDVALMLPYSRSGRPMLAKPDAGMEESIAGLSAIGESGRAALLALPAGAGVAGPLTDVLTDTTVAALLAAGARAGSSERDHRVRETARVWLANACNADANAFGHDAPVAELEQSLAVATGARPPDLHWALGYTWRALYPAVVQRLGANGLPEGQWPAFRRLASAMERVAFGPPAVNAAKLLALIEARRVDLAHVRGGRLVALDGVTAVTSAGGGRQVDVAIDAVLQEPGAGSPGDASLLGDLIARGHARVPAHRRGIEVAPDGACIARDGRRCSGLSAYGRPTEDWVIGNDTLIRALHPIADRWARGVTGRARARSAAATGMVAA